MSIKDEKELIVSLEFAYRLLSASLYQPSSEWLEADLYGNLKGALGVIAPSATGRADTMEGSLRTLGETELSVVYARLFVGPFSLGAPPYGSFYLEPEKKVMGETTVAVQQFYREAGLSLDKEFTEMPDHIAVELEFLSYLLQKALAAMEEGGEAAFTYWTEKRKSFLQRFFVGWYGEFCVALRHSESDFYMALADCIEVVVQRDLELLHMTEAGN